MRREGGEQKGALDVDSLVNATIRLEYQQPRMLVDGPFQGLEEEIRLAQLQ